MDIKKKITQELEIRPAQTEAVIKLIDEGNTIPFISRYRKDVTGGMNDEQLRAAGVPAGLVRMSCGLESREDLIADISQALDAI